MTAIPGLHVEARGVSRVFRGDRSGPVCALREVSLDAAPGERVTLSGRSGSGKTTLLCLIGGLLNPTTGSVVLDGVDLARMTRGDRARMARSIGLVPQSALLIRRLPVWENVAYSLVPLGVPSAERRDLALVALARVGVEALAWRRPEQLSGGEQRRVALARAIVQAPRLLLADEPTSNLDPESISVVCDVLAAVHATGCTVIVASHDPRVIANGREVGLLGGRIAYVDGQASART